MSGALVVVPPYLGYLAGPQAGPAALAAAGAAAGVEVEVLDLNAAWLRGHLPAPGVAVAEVVGDHARPTGGFVRAARSWRSLVAPWLGVPVPGWAAGEDPLWSLCFSHRAVYAAAEALAGSPEGRAWVERMPSSPPRFVGVSVLWSSPHSQQSLVVGKWASPSSARL